jgi:Uma2 family endonuclease
MATVQTAAEQRVLLHDVSWKVYETLLKECDERPIRMTYDHGSLEIMTLSHGHERYGKLLARFIETLTFELNIPLHSGKSTTFKKVTKKRGLEPDECYWIQHERQMHGKMDFDIDTDPPPDLAIEVDITSSSLDRMSIYADLGVLEVWRFDGEALRVYHLGKGSKYTEHDRSRAFPFLPMEGVMRFLRLGDSQDETSLMRSFVAWVREEILPRVKKRKQPKRNNRQSNGRKKPK